MYWHPKTSMFSRAAELGVETFFVISGFLITGILLDNRSEEQKSLVLKNFYCRRFLRIFPLFYLVLGMAVLLDSDGLRQSWGWHFGYLSNLYFYLHGWTGQLGHFWSLAVEEQFYLVWPLLILSVSMRSLPFVLITCIFSAPVYAVYMTVSHPGANGPNSAAILMPSCLGALGLGAFLAYAIRRRLAMPWITRGLFGAGLTGTVLWYALGSAEWLAPLNRLAEDFLLGWLVFGVAQGLRGPAGWLLSWSPVVYLGKISYGLYIIHNFARPLLEGALKGLRCPDGVAKLCNEKAAAIFLFTAITVGLASFSWYFWEKPLNDLKRHFPYPPKTQPMPALPPVGKEA